jgi:hypothetical protein
MKTAAFAGRESARESAAQIWRLFWLVVLVAHVFLAVGWWWLEPGGFGFDHPRFWTNTIAPPIGLGVTIVALAALHAGRASALCWLLPIWAWGWAAAAVAGRIVDLLHPGRHVGRPRLGLRRPQAGQLPQPHPLRGNQFQCTAAQPNRWRPPELTLNCSSFRTITERRRRPRDSRCFATAPLEPTRSGRAVRSSGSRRQGA